MKQYLGIITSVIYALIVRVLAAFDIIEINSISYLLIAPVILGFIPFFFSDENFYKSLKKPILYPLASVLSFLVIAVITGLEDLICFMIIGLPYIAVSSLVSYILYDLLKDKKGKISKNMLSILFLPIVLGSIEKELPKQVSNEEISNTIIIHKDVQTVYSNLFEVPDMRNSRSFGISNYLGVPRPLFSTYDKEQNIRKGYFENGVILYETVEHSIPNAEIIFKINVAQSNLKSSPTLQHVMNSGSINFQNITYTLHPVDENSTKLTLSTSFEINSNLNFYGQYWSNLIIHDFEKHLLLSLKVNLEESSF